MVDDTSRRTAAEEVAEDYQIEDPWEELIRNYLVTMPGQPVTIHEVMEHALDMDPDRRAAHHTRRIAATLKRIGMERKRIMVAGSRQSAWVRAK